MKAKKNIGRGIAALAAAITLMCPGACVPGHNNYSSFATLPDHGWAYADTLKFLPELDDSLARGRIVLAVRHTAAYPYANLWIELSTEADSTGLTEARTDTINMRLSDRNGRWLGRGLGASYQTADTLPAVYTLADSAAVRVRHVMRVDTLADVEQVGIIFIPQN